MTTNKPATPLPYRYLRDEGQFIVDANGNIVAEIPCQGVSPEHGDYLTAACNAYPKLIEDRARLVEALQNLATGVPTHEDYYRAQALLRELGEA